MAGSAQTCRFIVSVASVAAGGCRAGHRVGDHFEFGCCTPDGLCAEAFHGMYPILHAMRLEADQPHEAYLTSVTFPCPNAGTVSFEIRRLEMVTSRG